MSNRPIRYAALLRRELSARNASFAALHQLSHVTSYGEAAVTVYQAFQCDQKHGISSRPSANPLPNTPHLHSSRELKDCVVCSSERKQGAGH
jgi:hypothetical protein